MLFIKNTNIYAAIVSIKHNSLAPPIRFFHFLLIDQSEPSLLEPANKSETAMPKSTFAAFYEKILDDFLMPILKKK